MPSRKVFHTRAAALKAQKDMKNLRETKIFTFNEK